MAEQLRVNVRGTLHVLDGAEAAGAERVVHVSSVATWGYDFRSDLSSEDAPARVSGRRTSTPRRPPRSSRCGAAPRSCVPATSMARLGPLDAAADRGDPPGTFVLPAAARGC